MLFNVKNININLGHLEIFIWFGTEFFCGLICDHGIPLVTIHKSLITNTK